MVFSVTTIRTRCFMSAADILPAIPMSGYIQEQKYRWVQWLIVSFGHFEMKLIEISISYIRRD